MIQVFLTVSMGKRLIARAVAAHPAVTAALRDSTVVVIAGTTNGYVAEELLAATGQGEGFSRMGFRRGITTPPGTPLPKAELAGDVVLVKGTWQQGKTIFDVVSDLQTGDIVIKGANAVNLAEGKAGVYIGHPESGTIGATLPIAVGRRVKLLIPVGLEKRVMHSIDEIAATVNDPACFGPRMMPVAGDVLTELEAVALLTGAEAHLVAAGGIYGAEGGVWLAVDDSDSDTAGRIKLLTESLAAEGPCEA